MERIKYESDTRRDILKEQKKTNLLLSLLIELIMDTHKEPMNNFRKTLREIMN